MPIYCSKFCFCDLNYLQKIIKHFAFLSSGFTLNLYAKETQYTQLTHTKIRFTVLLRNF